MPDPAFLMPAKPILRPCGWCGKLQSAREDRKHFAVCPSRVTMHTDDGQTDQMSAKVKYIIVREEMSKAEFLSRYPAAKIGGED